MQNNYAFKSHFGWLGVPSVHGQCPYPRESRVKNRNQDIFSETYNVPTNIVFEYENLHKCAANYIGTYLCQGMFATI